MNEAMFPHIVANVDGHDRATDLISYQLAVNRIVFLTGEIDDLKAASLISQLLYLDQRSADDITLIINSPGGSISAGLAIYDVIRSLRSRVATVALGMAASMGAFLLAAAGSPGLRYAAADAEIMIHQPLGGVQGQASDITLVAERIQNNKRKLAAILAAACGKPARTLIRDMDRDKWMSPQQALDYGMIDRIGLPEWCHGGEV